MSSEHLRRRTFAIISHPDAGKTTLTEKILLSGGAIRLAGAVRARGNNRRARSDWMKIERERGISVTSSVMTFEYRDLVFNLLDTPGHEDFSEDTYRTLTAVDSAVMVIDAARGIEAQTLKLFEVCRLRDIPIIAFINKVDREARDPFELIEEIQDRLALDTSPMVWPVGMGADFQGCFDFSTNEFLTAQGAPSGGYDKAIPTTGLGDAVLDNHIPAPILESFRENAELARGGYPEFDAEAYRAGHLTPIVFGSALRDYSVQALVDFIADHAPPPRPSPADTRTVDPGEDEVSGFVFKVQANMDPNHRDRVAFMRLSSGRFQRGMKLRQVRTGKDIVVHSPILFLAQDREIASEAGPGDVIGIPNHGTVRVGDTFTQGESLRFTGLPAFAPEHLSRIRQTDTSKVKQLRRALEDLAEEGLIQVFRPSLGAHFIIGVVGTLQFDVLVARAAQEYRIDISFEPAGYEVARWIRANSDADLEAFIAKNPSSVVRDNEGRPVFLARNAWDLDYTQKNNESLEFLKTRELD
ncbi:Peptide chain release factor 3 [hydrothermal vent metagenome]|uniref:Peptide chain release factor 3 n=1 Tax=hydrothermal vent metagenome TaxID=652676 RepID=A0A3B0TL97_9ZZZZ